MAATALEMQDIIGSATFEKEVEVTQNLGTMLPIYDPHAVSVSLPLWEHVIGYEESDPKVINDMKCGYPRFRLPNSCQGLQAVLLGLYKLIDSGEKVFVKIFGNGKIGTTDAVDQSGTSLKDDQQYNCYILPSAAVSRRFQQFMQTNNSEEKGMETYKVKSFEIADSTLVANFFPMEGSVKAKKYWQHCGEIVTGRQCEKVLKNLLDSFVDAVLSSNHKDPFDVLSHLPHYFNDHDLVIAVAPRDIAQMPSILKPQTPVQQVVPVIPSTAYNTIVDRIRTVVNHRDSSNNSTTDKQTFSQRPMTVRDVSREDIVIVPTGMAAIFSAFRIVLEAYKEQFMNEKTCQFVMFGFPYLDTLKVLIRPELNEGGCHFFGHGDDSDLEKLEHLLQGNMLSDLGDYMTRQATNSNGTGPFQMPLFQNKIAAIFVEFPTNPLMKCSQMQRLFQMARRYGVLLVADDTISNFANVNLLSRSDLSVDILCTSLTKIFNGASNLMAGSVVINPNTPNYDGGLSKLFKQMIATADFPLLAEPDAIVLEYNSRSYLLRSTIINKNALALATFLADHPAVKQAFYPTLNAGKKTYDSIKRSDVPLFDFGKDGLYDQLMERHPGITKHEAGYGCLVSFELKPHLDTTVFYDNLQVNKGPSLGTNFTLVCPYTMLAHYFELDWADSFNVPSHLIRISVGFEDESEIIRRFSDALEETERIAAEKVTSQTNTAIDSSEAVVSADENI